MSTCRGNEVSAQDQLAIVLRRLEDTGSTITDVQVDNLSFEAQVDLISNMVQLPRALCLPLAKVVQNQTQGNVLFLLQFLRSLEEDGTLYQDEDRGGIWTWKAEALIVSLEGTGDNDLMVQLLSNKIKELPSEVIEVVKVASCLANDFTEDILGAAVSSDVEVALEIAEEEGIIAYNFDTGAGCFSHDKFQEAAYSLISEKEKAGFHLQIAETLKRQLTPNTSKKYVAVILNQIAAGIDDLKDPTEREQWAFICLKAARKAGKAASYTAAREYVELGIQLLERRNWRDQYNLSLDLYNSACELAFCTGKHDRTHELVKEILENGLSFDDKLQAHIVKIMTLSSEHNTKVAITYCVEVLRRMGQPFPKTTPQTVRIMVEYMKTKQKLARYSDEDVMNLPPLTDPKISRVMVVIHLLFPLVQQNRYEYSPLVAFRLVHLTLKHGLCSISKTICCLRKCFLVPVACI